LKNPKGWRRNLKKVAETEEIGATEVEIEEEDLDLITDPWAEEIEAIEAIAQETECHEETIATAIENQRERIIQTEEEVASEKIVFRLKQMKKTIDLIVVMTIR